MKRAAVLCFSLSKFIHFVRFAAFCEELGLLQAVFALLLACFDMQERGLHGLFDALPWIGDVRETGTKNA